MDSTNKFLKKNLSQEHHGPRRFSWQTCFPYNVGWWIEHQRMTETKLTKCFCSPVLASMVVCVMITIPKQYMLHRCVDGTVRMLLYRSTVIYEELSSRVWSSRNYALYAGSVTLYYDTHGAGGNTRYMILSFPRQMILWWKYFFGRWTCVCNVFRGTCSATVHLRETTRVEHDSKNVLIILFSIDSHERNVICRCVPYILQHCADDTGRHMPYGKLVGWKSPMVFWETPEKFK